MRVRYVNISITEDLAKKIDEYIEKSKEGYRSRAEFLSEAVRLRLGIAKLKK
jgi:metal-responsive CopG/Arc/MetJ family transcriptional regulator